jgi:hypothetical protein
MEDQTERLIGHLAMIQAVIARMASNSFALKTVTVILAAGVIALYGAVQTPSLLYATGALFPTVIFAWMDARYLRLERMYRRLYDEVRRGGAVEPFDMDVSKYESTEPAALWMLSSWSIAGLYLPVFIVIAILAVDVLGR